MEFYLKELAPKGHPVDIDNLCEPVFSVLVNKLGWFGGHRPNIQWWYASKVQDEYSGLRLTLVTSGSWNVDMGKVRLNPFFEGIYAGRLPRSATDPIFADWVKTRLQSDTQLPVISCAVLMRFGNTAINLGNVATGSIKALLDGLYPLLGGSPGRPEDWRIQTLAVEKGSTSLSNNAVSVTAWEVV